MNWTKLSAIAEIVSSVAILVTVVYLSVQTGQLSVQTEQMSLQTQQNTIAIRTAIRQEMVTNDIQYLLDASNHPGRASLWCKPELTETEKSEINTSMIALVRTRESQWFQFQDGALDEQTWISYRNALSGNLSNPRSREWWNRISVAAFHPEFVADIDTYLAGIEPNQNCNNRLID
jgi:hypothetical protein